MKNMSKELSRREFIRLGALSAVGAGLAACGLGRSEAQSDPTVVPTATGTPTPTGTPEGTVMPSPTATEVASATPTATEMAGEYWDTPYSNPASNEGSVFALRDSDGAEVNVDLDGAVGFVPDADLRVSDLTPNALDPVPADAGNFQVYLNTARDGFQPVAGFTDGTNDYNQYKDHQSGPQVPMYSWMVHTGLRAELPGIGRVEGGEGRAFMVLVLNRTERVHRFPTNSVHVEAGFQGWGRIWRGESEYVQEAEERLTNHYRTRLGQGVPETGFIGQCDQVDNCDSVTVVTVERMQWGNELDGSPRDQFRLIRAETVATAR